MRNARRAAVSAAGVAITALTVAACGSQVSAAGHAKPPELHIGAGSSVAAGEAVPLPPPVPGRLALAGGYLLVGALPATPTHAAVWRWPDRAAGRDDVVHLGALLGLTGAPQRHAYGWLLATPGGELRVRDGDSLPWSYVRSDLAACAPYGIDIDNRDGGGSGCAAASAAEQTRSAPPVDDAAARALLINLGVAGVEHSQTGVGHATVTVAPTVGSLATQGIETSVDVDARGVRSATGHLGVAKAGSDYPLRSAKAAFDDLGNAPHPMIAQYCGPMPPAARGSGLVASPALAPSGRAVPMPDPLPTAVPLPRPCVSPAPMRINGATLGLLAMWDGATGGPNVLVPAWFFRAEDSAYPLPVVAVDPSFIDGAPASPVSPAN